MGAFDVRCRILTVGKASLLVKAGVCVGQSDLWGGAVIGSTIGLGVRLTISNRLSLLVEAE